MNNIIIRYWTILSTIFVLGFNNNNIQHVLAQSSSNMCTNPTIVNPTYTETYYNSHVDMIHSSSIPYSRGQCRREYVNVSVAQWYYITNPFTIPVNHYISTNYSETTVDTDIVILSGTCNNLICLGGNDDIIPGINVKSFLEFTMAPERSYYVVILWYGIGNSTVTFTNERVQIRPPTPQPTGVPTTIQPTNMPTISPTVSPTGTPTISPTLSPTISPTLSPTSKPTISPTLSPTSTPTVSPTLSPTSTPTISPTLSPTGSPTVSPTLSPTGTPTISPTLLPTNTPTVSPKLSPTSTPTASPTSPPTVSPTSAPTVSPTSPPTSSPTVSPTLSPTVSPTSAPTVSPSTAPTSAPIMNPTGTPSTSPTASPSSFPIQDCDITYNLYNSRTDQFVTTIMNNRAIVDSLPPCGRVNIEAVVPCGVSSPNDSVIIELYRGSRLYSRRTEYYVKYFLFGNSGNSIYDGRIPAGTYSIRTIVDGISSQFTNFTMGGRCK